VALLPPGYRFFSGRTLDLLGRALAASDRPRARQAFEEAANVFDACGAVIRRDRSLDALRRLGGTSRGTTAGLGPARLTARERDVARLAAQRRTAPEIARELFIGERTVESHLARIYAKLGIGSKLDLAERAGELGLADPEERPRAGS
jgi:DNA-binding CsgD family transcriptional regulator